MFSYDGGEGLRDVSRNSCTPWQWLWESPYVLGFGNTVFEIDMYC